MKREFLQKINAVSSFFFLFSFCDFSCIRRLYNYTVTDNYVTSRGACKFFIYITGIQIHLCANQVAVSSKQVIFADLL